MIRRAFPARANALLIGGAEFLRRLCIGECFVMAQPMDNTSNDPRLPKILWDWFSLHGTPTFLYCGRGQSLWFFWGNGRSIRFFGTHDEIHLGILRLQVKCRRTIFRFRWTYQANSWSISDVGWIHATGVEGFIFASWVWSRDFNLRYHFVIWTTIWRSKPSSVLCSQTPLYMENSSTRWNVFECLFRPVPRASLLMIDISRWNHGVGQSVLTFSWIPRVFHPHAWSNLYHLLSIARLSGSTNPLITALFSASESKEVNFANECWNLRLSPLS